MPGSLIVAFHLIAVATLAVSNGDLERGAWFHGTVASALDEVEQAVSGGLVQPYEELIDAARDRLGHERFDAALTEGSARSWADGVQAGFEYLDAIVVAPVAVRYPPTAGDASELAAPGARELTPRQREVLVLLAQGLSNKEIAAVLGLTPKSVMHHTTAIYQATGARGRSEATAWAFRAGLAG
jgi:DNA-binding CsgD family transcriptional regulator